MNHKLFYQRLMLNGTIINAMLKDMPLEESRWKPDPDRWSVLEVINHLYDEEREDFRLHLDIMLHNPDNPWPPIDPFNWVTTRKYNERQLLQSLNNFLSERQKSLNWLNGLQSPDWESSVQAPWGAFRAGDMLVSWIVHDQWHVQQLVMLIRDLTSKQAAPYNVQYAGTLE
jgi:hypothetical protein